MKSLRYRGRDQIKRMSVGSGFTIVELLIVIVVIAILATIVIVAYSGITQNARISTLQSGLSSAYTTLANDNTLTGAYPATLATANNGQGITATNGNTYNYVVNNTLSPAYYCLAETNTTASLTYFVTGTSNIPQVGGCSVTNLMVNPNFGSGSTTGYGSNSSDGTGSVLLSTDRAHVGTESLKVIASSTAANNGVSIGINNPTTGTYTFSAWIYIPSTGGFTYLAPLVWSGSLITHGPAITARDQWIHISVVAPVNAGTATWYFYDGSGAGSEATGNAFYLNQAMETQGSTPYNYADGSYPGWIWNGTASASTSTGPPL